MALSGVVLKNWSVLSKFVTSLFLWTFVLRLALCRHSPVQRSPANLSDVFSRSVLGLLFPEILPPDVKLRGL